jgi:DNA-binding NarL/FixJ family response regulator
MTPIRIYLIDDQAMIRGAFQALLETDASFQVVGSTGDPRRGVREVTELRPDLVVLDITMPGVSGLDILAPLKKGSAATKVLIASNHEGSIHVRRAMAAGADGYLSKDSEPEELRLAIASIYRGDTYLSPKVSATLSGGTAGDGAACGVSTVLERLTPREREVFQLLAIGKANKEVADVLELSLGTVKKHRENLQRKLECRSGAELARLAIREGLLGP